MLSQSLLVEMSPSQPALAVTCIGGTYPVIIEAQHLEVDSVPLEMVTKVHSSP